MKFELGELEIDGLKIDELGFDGLELRLEVYEFKIDGLEFDGLDLDKF